MQILDFFKLNLFWTSAFSLLICQFSYLHHFVAVGTIQCDSKDVPVSAALKLYKQKYKLLQR